MNSKRETVEQAIRDLRDHQKNLEMAYNQYLDNELEDYVEVMDKFYDERVNIATNLFKDFSMKPRPEGTLYRRPESTPPFKSGDFRSTRGKKPLPYPMIIGRATKRMSGVPRLIARIDHFIEQLETKLSNRKDLQEKLSMQLTEAKLKHMILEAMHKSKSYEKLKSLMSTKEGYIQAESLYEMLRDTFDEEEQMHMDIFFEPLILARERKNLVQKYQEAYDVFQNASAEDKEQAFYDMEEAEIVMDKKNDEFGESFVKMKSHVKNNRSISPREFDEVVLEATWEIVTGFELPPKK